MILILFFSVVAKAGPAQLNANLPTSVFLEASGTLTADKRFTLFGSTWRQTLIRA